MLVLPECLDKSLHLISASVWVPEHETQLLFLRRSRDPAYSRTLRALHFHCPGQLQYMSVTSKWSSSTTRHEVIALASYVTWCNEVVQFLTCCVWDASAEPYLLHMSYKLMSKSPSSISKGGHHLLWYASEGPALSHELRSHASGPHLSIAPETNVEVQLLGFGGWVEAFVEHQDTLSANGVY